MILQYVLIKPDKKKFENETMSEKVQIAEKVIK